MSSTSAQVDAADGPQPKSNSSEQDGTQSPPSVGLDPPPLLSNESAKQRARTPDLDEEQEEEVGVEEDDHDKQRKPAPPVLMGAKSLALSPASNSLQQAHHQRLMRDMPSRSPTLQQPMDAGHMPSRKRVSSVVSSCGEKRAATKVCRVCGDKAYSYNFNVITCESCKAFFRRNANKEKEIRCPFNDQCDINMVSRRFCQRCRLQKCFDVGMKKEWIMTEEARVEKKQRVMDNRERRMVDNPLPRHQQHHSFIAAAQHSPVAATAQLPQHVSVTLPVQPPQPSSSVVVSRRDSFDNLPSPNVLMAAGFRPPSLVVGNQDSGTFVQPTATATSFSTYSQQQAQAALASRVAVAAQAQMAAAQAQMQQAHLQRLQQQQQQQQQQVPPPAPTVDDQMAGAMVTIPRNLLVRLVEGQQQPQPQPPVRPLIAAEQHCGRCVCTCLCGAYPSGTLVTDATIAKLLSASSAHDRTVQQETVNLNLLRSAQLLQQQQTMLQNSAAAASSLQWFGTQQGPFTVANRLPIVLDDKRDDVRAGQLYDSKLTTVAIVTNAPTTPIICPPSVGPASLFEEAVGRASPLDKDCQPLSEDDQDRVLEIMRANEVWSEQLDPNTKDGAQHTKGDPNKVDMVNMADGAIRRLIKMTKRMESFRKIEHRDQIQLLKCSCMEYLILRGAMAYDPSKNAWVGPTQKAGYTVKMEAMKETKNNMFENSIRFYATFKEEWRTNEKVMLVLGAIIVFNPDCPGLKNRDAVRVEYHIYRRILKRLLHEVCGFDTRRTLTEYEGLMDRLADLKILNDRAQKMLMEVSPTDMEPLLLEMFDR